MEETPETPPTEKELGMSESPSKQTNIFWVSPLLDSYLCMK